MNEMNAKNIDPGDNESANNAKYGFIVVWGFLAFVLSIIMAFHKPEEAGFWVRSLLVIVSIIGGTPLGTLGALLGDFIRRLACPDMIFTSGGMGSLLKERLFWAIGPQAIGLFIGTYIGYHFTARMLAIHVFTN